MKKTNALMLANIGVMPLMTAFGGLNGDLLQYYASGYFAFSEEQIGLAIGLLVLTIPFQLISTKFVGRWGCRKILLFGYGLRFLLIPMLLLVPAALAMNLVVGELLFYAIVFVVHLTHVCTFGVAWQPLVRSATAPEERGAFFGKMRFMFNGYNLLFFWFLGVVVGKSISDADFLIIVFLLMIYCAFAFLMLFHMSEPGLGMTRRAQSGLQSGGILKNLQYILKKPLYRTLLSINVLRLPSSLPMFIVYLWAIGLSANQIAFVVAVKAIGMMTGFLVWGRVIQHYGFTKGVQWSLILLSVTGGLWFLFVLTPDSTGQIVLFIFSLIAALTAFLHCGLGLSLVTAVHNNCGDDNVVVVLTLFDVIDMGLESVMAAFTGFYIYTFFGDNGSSHMNILFDPYMTFCLLGAVLCAISAAIGYRRLDAH